MATLEYAGRDRRHVLYTSRDKAVIVDTKYLVASVLAGDEAKDAPVMRPWSLSREPDVLVKELAEAALVSSASARGALDFDSSFRRGYTVPARVRENALSALGDHALSPMSALAASALSTGGQVSCADVLWVHRFFEHTDATEAGPARWAAWGGNEGRAWASNLAARLEYDSVVADAGSFDVPGTAVFTDGADDNKAFWGRVTSHGHVDSVFLQRGDKWLCWANGDWAEAAAPTNRVELDNESALFACGALLDAPDRAVDLRQLDPVEWLVADAALPNTDWTMLRHVMTAAGDGDGEYTPEERSENASSQLRDANGRFAKVGDSGLMKQSGIRGTIKTVNPTGNQLVVDGEDGNTYMIDPKEFEIDGGAKPAEGGKPDPSAIKNMPDFSKILGQPRASKNTPKAFLKNLLQPMGPSQLKDVLNDYAGFVNKERQERAGDFKGGTGWQESRPETAKERAERKKHEANRDKAIKTYEDFFKKYGSKKKPKKKNVTADAGGADIVVPNVEFEGATPDEVTPDRTDVQPLYLALVDRDDPRAVMELVSLVPSGPNDSAPATFKRAGGEWVAAPEIMQDLRSATPPPTVMLDEEDYEAVLTQVDNETPDEDDSTVTASGQIIKVSEQGGQVVLSLVSAGGADRNRGGAEHLRRYWTTGKGGLKIRWGTPGDWRRCVRQLSKHLGPRAKGYCALRHKEMTGMWPGDRRNRKEYTMEPNGAVLTSLDSVRREPAVIRAAAYSAQVETALAKVRGDKFTPVPVRATDIDAGRSGRAFKIPIVVPEGISSGDKRHFQRGSLGLRTLPLPLLWQPFTGEGHDGSPIVGRIDHVERTSAGLGNAYGVFDTGPYGQEAQRLVENGMLRWVSVDLDKFEVDEALTETDPDGKMNIRKGRMMAATLVSKPAFQECTLELLPIEGETEDPMTTSQPTPITAAAGISAAIPVEPPAAWFERPSLKGPTPLRVTPDGQVFGHIATWATSHVGLPGSTRPPRSNTEYAYFHTGLVRTKEGKDVKVGQLTLAGGHASLDKSAEAAAKHYDDTASALADVHAGEDSYGIWVAGALRPGTTPEQIRAFRASAPSGDWRFVQGVGLEMIAVCQVNVPGFPIPQALAASGHTNALVAAGTADLVALRAQENSVSHEALAAAARQRVFLALDVDGYLTEFKDFSPEKRAELTAAGKAMSDGSFPIENTADLRRALQAYEKVSRDKQAAVRRHIVRCARTLGKSSSIPAAWREAGLSPEQIDARDKVASLVASARVRRAQELADRINRPKLEAQVAALAARVGAQAKADNK